MIAGSLMLLCLQGKRCKAVADVPHLRGDENRPTDASSSQHTTHKHESRRSAIGNRERRVTATGDVLAAERDETCPELLKMLSGEAVPEPFSETTNEEAIANSTFFSQPMPPMMTMLVGKFSALETWLLFEKTRRSSALCTWDKVCPPCQHLCDNIDLEHVDLQAFGAGRDGNLAAG